MSKTLVSVNDVPIGQRVRVQQVSTGDPQEAFERLLELGIYPGRHLTAIYRPTGGATLIQLDNGNPFVIANMLCRGILCCVEKDD